MATRNNTFILKRSNVVGKIPALSGLTLGELALNTADAKLYSLYTGGLSGATEVREIGWDKLSITGNTSGDCITNLYVQNLNSCSPLHIQPINTGDVYIGENGGVNVGIGTSLTTAQLTVKGSGTTITTKTASFKDGNGVEFFKLTDDRTFDYNGIAKGEGSTNSFTSIIPLSSPVTWYSGVYVNTTNLEPSAYFKGFCSNVTGSNGIAGTFTNNSVGISTHLSNWSGWGVETTGGIFVNGDKLYLKGDGTGATSNTEIVNSSSNPLLYVLNNGNVGIGTSSPTEKLEVNGKTKTTTLQVTSGATAGYVLTALDSNGNTYWASPTSASTTFNNVDYIDFNTTATTTTQFGRVNWDNDTGTLNVAVGDGGTGLIDLQVGQEEIVRVYNAEGTTLQKGEIVYVSGSQGNRPTVKRALAVDDGYSVTTLGMIDLSIAPGTEGYVTTFGIISNLNTLGLTGGTPIWLSPTTPGAYTSTKPIAPYHTVLIGYVVRVSATVGSIFVNISNGWELDELHDVRISGATTGDLLVRSSYSGTPVWVNSKTLNGDYTINGELTVTGSINISGFTSTDFYVTGGTFNSGTNTLTLDRQNGSVSITGFTSSSSGDNYVTGGTYSSGTLTLDRQNGSVTVTGFTTGIKAGVVAGTSFSGNPKKYTVTFTSAYPNANYSITITGNVNRSFTWESKAANGFTINSNANTSFTEDVNWITMSYGEF